MHLKHFDSAEIRDEEYKSEREDDNLMPSALLVAQVLAGATAATSSSQANVAGRYKVI